MLHANKQNRVVTAWMIDDGIENIFDKIPNCILFDVFYAGPHRLGQARDSADSVTTNLLLSQVQILKQQ